MASNILTHYQSLKLEANTELYRMKQKRTANPSSTSVPTQTSFFLNTPSQSNVPPSKVVVLVWFRGRPSTIRWIVANPVGGDSDSPDFLFDDILDFSGVGILKLGRLEFFPRLRTTTLHLELQSWELEVAFVELFAESDRTVDGGVGSVDGLEGLMLTALKALLMEINHKAADVRTRKGRGEISRLIKAMKERGEGEESTSEVNGLARQGHGTGSATEGRNTACCKHTAPTTGGMGAYIYCPFTEGLPQTSVTSQPWGTIRVMICTGTRSDLLRERATRGVEAE
ncbi:hypothetical protein P691DRAFT_789417 [Macrolepiota fuliginosa MF-IS2]|uniref:Uncharacterized protein n=1 Tax=Macrolepiota fuliginosa MF-IS2 TaxID=1400762 RepID=A0A9P6C6K7_9AGAR|nr:hypothetical protein P691DRAFT_789417 [Macrolepiota fuliginosa MF-IS2]